MTPPLDYEFDDRGSEGSRPQPASTIDLTSNADDDSMQVDDEQSNSTRDASSTLISSVAKGKRKAVDTDSHNDSEPTSPRHMGPPLSAHGMSAPSVTSATSSEKRRKVAKPKKETPAAASMRSSRETSTKPPTVSSEIMHQQVLARFDNLVDKIDKPGTEANADPLATRLAHAIKLLESDQIEFNLSDDDFAIVAMAYSTQPGYITTYLSIKQSSGRHAFIRRIITQVDA